MYLVRVKYKHSGDPLFSYGDVWFDDENHAKAYMTLMYGFGFLSEETQRNLLRGMKKDGPIDLDRFFIESMDIAREDTCMELNK